MTSKKKRRPPQDPPRPRSGAQRPASRPTGYEERQRTPEARRTSQGTGRPRAYDFESARTSQGTSRPRAYDFESARSSQGQGTGRPRPDNSILFPTQQVRRPAGSGAQPRPRPGPRPGEAPAPRRLRPTQPQRRKHRRLTRAEMRRRRLARRLTACGLLLCVIGAGLYLTMTMLFKIHTIQLQLADATPVAQAGGYSSEEILSALGVAGGENIFSFDPEAKAQALEQQFPLLEQIQVVRDYPNTVAVRVVEAVPTWTMETSRGWLTLSARMKILDCTGTQPDLPTLYGGEPVSAAPGEQLDYPPVPQPETGEGEEEAPAVPDGRLTALDTLTAALAQHGLLEGVTRIEFADTEQMAFLYQGRISVLLGTLNELEYKLDFAAYLLHNTDGKGCAETDTGRLDCSHVRGDGTIRPILAQGEPVLPSGYVAPPLPDPAPEALEAAEADPAAETTPAEPPAGTAPDPAAETTPAEPPAQTPAGTTPDPAADPAAPPV